MIVLYLMYVFFFFFLQIFSICLWLVFSFSWQHLSQSRSSLTLKKSRLPVISFMDHPSGVISKKSSPYSRSCIFSLMLVSRNFIVLPFTFRSMIHFELTFMKGVMSMSKFLFIYLFLHEHVQLFQHYLLKRLYFFIVFPLLLFQRTIDYIYVDISRL